MNTIAIRDTATGLPWRSYLLEARCEFLRLLRTPSYAIPTLLFPSLFYLLFGVLLNHRQGDAARYLLATYGSFGVMGVGLFAFGVTVAIERDQGLLRYKRALPMPPGAYLFAKAAMAVLFAAMAVSYTHLDVYKRQAMHDSIPSAAPLARLQGVRKRYGSVVALDGIDLALAPGETHALLGANGAGKSTAVALMLGLALSLIHI